MGPNLEVLEAAGFLLGFRGNRLQLLVLRAQLLDLAHEAADFGRLLSVRRHQLIRLCQGPLCVTLT